MIATVLDTETGATVNVHGHSPYEWAEGNWSCDCNRNVFGVDTGAQEGYCEGSKRFLVIKAVREDSDDREYTLNEYNADYPEELRARFKVLYVQRKAFICKYCEGVYADEPVSSCDCLGHLGKEPPHFIEGEINYHILKTGL